MDTTARRIVGFLAWEGTRWYVRRTVRRKLHSRRAGAIASAAVVAAGAGIVLATRHRA